MAGDEGHYECAVCGLRAVAGAATWFHVDFEREEAGAEYHWFADFCSQEHASAWLLRSLPEPDQVFEGVTEPAYSWWKGWSVLLAALGFLVVFALAAYGVCGLLSRVID
jgi:hypothetical protein